MIVSQNNVALSLKPPPPPLTIGGSRKKDLGVLIDGFRTFRDADGFGDSLKNGWSWSSILKGSRKVCFFY